MFSTLLRTPGGSDKFTSSAGFSESVFAENAGIPSTQNKRPEWSITYYTGELVV